MHSTLITLAIVAVIALIHFSYVDFRFRHRDGILWYWLLNPAPPLMWLSRAAIIAAVILALCVKFIGTTLIFAAILVGLVALHIVSLIILEAREHRGRP
jgi:L-asparagine transporter-like permease